MISAESLTQWHVLTLLSIAFLVSYLAFNRYTHGLRRIPGPFLASITSLWKLHAVWREEWPWLNVDLHEKYGPLVRIGPKHVSASTPEALNAVYIQKKGFRKVLSLYAPEGSGADGDQDGHV